MTVLLAALNARVTQALVAAPLTSSLFGAWFFILIVLSLDYLNSRRQRWRVGNVAIVGDASYITRRLRRSESDTNFLDMFQRGYDTVRGNLVTKLRGLIWQPVDQKVKAFRFLGTA
jgi:hypothetical protein